MSILGLVVEYNPFHQGHLYHLQQAKQLIQPTATVVVMSGSFTQRGEPAIVDKWARAQMALTAGVDLVLELPLAWATQSAPNFAAGAVQLLASIGATDICFGSELGSLSELELIADLLLQEPPAYQQALHSALDQGNSYATAQGYAIAKLLPQLDTYLFKQPNNTLAAMYLLAIKRHGLPMTAHTIKRLGTYHSIEMDTVMPSATAIRRQLHAGESVGGMPTAAAEILSDRIQNGRAPISWQQLAPLLLYRLRNQQRTAMLDWPEAGEGLGERLWLAARQTNNWGELLLRTKTRRFPLTRIQRLATYLLVGLTGERLQEIDVKQTPPYLRVLALNQHSVKVRKLLKHSKLPLIFSAAKADNSNTRLQTCLQLDVQATDIHTLAWTSGSQSGLDFTHPLVVADWEA